LLRTRGATRRQLARLVVGEALLVSAIGCALGLAAATVLGRTVLGVTTAGWSTSSRLPWTIGAALFGPLHSRVFIKHEPVDDAFLRSLIHLIVSGASAGGARPA
jgi:predicted lysophospholipase L1 biosynthesis ABC-type transport system permease subunit